jgi:hypothetical protein
MDKPRYETPRSADARAKKPSLGETLDELRKRLGRIEKHLIDIKEASRRQREEAIR